MRTKKRAAPKQPTSVEPTNRELEKFKRWSDPYAHIWSHVRVSALALRIDGQWIARSLAAVLTDRTEPRFPPVKTDQVQIVEHYVRLTQLEQLIAGITKGSLSSALSPTREPLAIANGDA